MLFMQRLLGKTKLKAKQIHPHVYVPLYVLSTNQAV